MLGLELVSKRSLAWRFLPYARTKPLQNALLTPSFRNTRSSQGLKGGRRPRLATLSRVTSPAAAISTDPAERSPAADPLRRRVSHKKPRRTPAPWLAVRREREVLAKDRAIKGARQVASTALP